MVSRAVRMPEQMQKNSPRAWGVGPKWGIAGASYFAVALVLHVIAYPRFAISQVPYQVLATVGGLMVGIGASCYIAAARTLRRSMKQGKLVTTGPYAIVRHPLYASNILLTVPGIALLVSSWLLLTVPPFMYVMLRIWVSAEEEALQERFGHEYEQYRRRTNIIFPRRRSRNGGKEGQ